MRCGANCIVPAGHSFWNFKKTVERPYESRHTQAASPASSDGRTVHRTTTDHRAAGGSGIRFRGGIASLRQPPDHAAPGDCEAPQGFPGTGTETEALVV